MAKHLNTLFSFYKYFWISIDIYKYSKFIYKYLQIFWKYL